MQIRNIGSSRNIATANVLSCDISIQGQVFVVVLAGVLCYDSLFSEYPGLPGMKLKIGNPKHKPAAATEVSWWTGSTEIVPDLKGLVIFRKSSAKHRCSPSPVNIGVVFERQKGLQKVATWAGLELATFSKYKALSSSYILMYSLSLSLQWSVFGLQYPSETFAVNVTYCTFKVHKCIIVCRIQ